MSDLKKQLIKWADKYETPDFIKNDPIQFPHRFIQKQDIEISAFLTSYLAFGKRSQIIKKVNELHSIMENSPYAYIQAGNFSGFPQSKKKFYRFIAYQDLYELLCSLRSYYLNYPDLETALEAEKATHPVEGLQKLFGHIYYIPSAGSNSASKRLNMFLRWVCRQNSCVDLGIWKSIDPSCLLIPLDIHVHRLSLNLGITTRKSADFITATEINNYFKNIFPNDPGRGDFSLFGYAINNPGYYL